jgi:hypothetical protein
MMNALPTRRYCAILLPLTTLLALSVSTSTACAQATVATPAIVSQAETPPTSKRFSLDIREASLHQALQALFAGRLQYSIAEDVPDKKVTLKVLDQPIDAVLPLLLKQASTSEKRLTYSIEKGVYNVRVVPVSSIPSRWVKITLRFVAPSVVLPSLQQSFHDAVNIIAHDADGALLIQAPEDKIPVAQQIIALLDVAPKNLVLRAEVVMVASDSAEVDVKPGASRNVLLATVLRTVSGQETDGEDKITGAPAQTARLGLVATATRLGDGDYEVRTRWDVALPLTSASIGAGPRLSTSAGAKPTLSKPAGAETPVRLEKRLSNASRFRPGDTNVVGGIVLSQYGLKGQILFFVTLTEVQDTPPKP